MRDRRARDQERAGHVDAEDVLEGRRREVEQRALAADAGVEDERVEAAEVVDRLDDGALGVRLDARVGDDREPADLDGDLPDRPGPPAGHADLVAVGREPARDRRADAGAAAGDERDPGHAAQVLDDLLVVDRVAEGEAEALADPHRREQVVLLVRGAEELERRGPLPDRRDDAVAAARARELVHGRVVVAAGLEPGEVADVDDRRVVVRRPGLREALERHRGLDHAPLVGGARARRTSRPASRRGRPGCRARRCA